MNNKDFLRTALGFLVVMVFFAALFIVAALWVQRHRNEKVDTCIKQTMEQQRVPFGDAAYYCNQKYNVD